MIVFCSASRSALGLGASAAPDLVEQFARRGRLLGHLIVEAVVGIGRKAQELCPLGTQSHHLGDQRAVVGRAAVLAALDPGLEYLLAQIAAGGELQKALARRPSQRDGIFALRAAFLGRRPRGVAGKARKPGEIALLQDQRISFLVRQHVLPELGAQARQLFVDGGEAILRPLVERTTRPHEAGVVTVEHPRLFRIKPELVPARIKIGDAGVERAVEIHRVAVAGQDRRNVAFHGFDGGRRVSAGQHEKDVADAIERAPALLQRLDGIGEGCRLQISGYHVELSAVRRQRPVEGRAEMLRLDLRQRRQAERAGPVGKQRVFGSGLRIGHGVHLAMNARLVTPSAPAAR